MLALTIALLSVAPDAGITVLSPAPFPTVTFQRVDAPRDWKPFEPKRTPLWSGAVGGPNLDWCVRDDGSLRFAVPFQAKDSTQQSMVVFPGARVLSTGLAWGAGIGDRGECLAERRFISGGRLTTIDLERAVETNHDLPDWPKVPETRSLELEGGETLYWWAELKETRVLRASTLEVRSATAEEAALVQRSRVVNVQAGGLACRLPREATVPTMVGCDGVPFVAWDPVARTLQPLTDAQPHHESPLEGAFPMTVQRMTHWHDGARVLLPDEGLLTVVAGYDGGSLMDVVLTAPGGDFELRRYDFKQVRYSVLKRWAKRECRGAVVRTPVRPTDRFTSVACVDHTKLRWTEVLDLSLSLVWRTPLLLQGVTSTAALVVTDQSAYDRYGRFQHAWVAVPTASTP
jgi:hypothetical protein